MRCNVIVLTISFLLGLQNLDAQLKSLTARQVIDQIKENTNGYRGKESVDNFKAGNPDAVVTGIVTTMFASYDVLKKAVASGSNLIIVHEPLFYNHVDDTTALVKSGNQVYRKKKEYIEQNGLIVWRFHDNIHAMKPDGIIKGVVQTLGWEKYQTQADMPLFILPETTVKELAIEVSNKLNSMTMRVIGNPDLKVAKVGFIPGAPGSDWQIAALERKDIDVLLIGESREWETIEYARDAMNEGMHKALIVIGHIPSEETGMEECARWLKTFIAGIPVDFIASGEPFWMVVPTVTSSDQAEQ